MRRNTEIIGGRMANFLKGNYRIPKGGGESSGKSKSPKSLTERFEEEALAKLGGSLCFVTKGKTFVWAGDEGEKASS
jgi:hypothetical protein